MWVSSTFSFGQWDSFAGVKSNIVPRFWTFSMKHNTAICCFLATSLESHAHSLYPHQFPSPPKGLDN